ncbi:inhibitor of Bruton tyrosine kinase [Canna indica]|uniref:Inhibitor of Bruton tyrosine kinase n=1 Tax=Canna indica TaxID=4628 RepID=A0AAQ3KVB4_9LILI|nr:inhibitor of Bruton tyrosine kinase [Canna indica]
MEGLIPHSGSLRQTSIRKFPGSSSHKDLWCICRQGSVAELDSALQLLKKNGGNIDARNAFGLTPLHIATWRNHVPMVKRLLAAGADPDARDGESGWSTLHRALHFGHLAVACILLQAGASLTLEDSKCRIPVDLLSGPVPLTLGNAIGSDAIEVLSWGSGTNYQLGTGNAHIQKLPCKVDALQGVNIKNVSASKFHSVAVGSDGQLYTWGFGRGGRLGHPDFDVHSGQAAVITPRQVILGLGCRRVKAVAAAKHHTIIATESGEVFTWGSNREGQLGYTSVDTQPTPRRVSSLRAKVIAVAAANKHSVAIVESGEVFTWGSNKEGQLGYGTSNSASNSFPRIVEYLKGKIFRGVSAAKYHTVVLGADGEVFTWGHRLVTPKRVVITRNTKKNGAAPLKFHRKERLNVVSVAAGMTHSTALTDDGSLFYWISSNPDLRCQQLYSMCGRNVVSISAGKYWTSAVTTTGEVYMWDGKKCKDDIPIPTRLHGVKRATSVCVGETHLLVLCALYNPIYPPIAEASMQKPLSEVNMEADILEDDIFFKDIEVDTTSKTIKEGSIGRRDAPSLKSLCEKVAIEFMAEPRNAIQLLEVADSLEAVDLRKHCEEIAIRNLDYILTVSATAVASTPLQIMAKLEKLLDTRSSEPWSYRCLPTPTATFPAIIDSDEEDNRSGYFRHRDNGEKAPKKHGDSGVDCFLQSTYITDQSVFKQIRAIKKKLQQIEILEAKKLNGYILDDQQIAKLQTRLSLESALAELGFPLEAESKMLTSALSDEKATTTEISRKQKRKSKQKVAQSENLTLTNEILEDQNSVKGSLDTKAPQVPENMEDAAVDVDTITKSELDTSHVNHKPISLSHTSYKISHSTTLKKKNKKGGLSMFLSGALDDTLKHAPPPVPKNDGPAWGGAKLTQGCTSLRDIQNEQNKTRDVIPLRSKVMYEDPTGPANSRKVQLNSFLPHVSSPVATVPARVPIPEGETNNPPWSSPGTSPGLNRPSLRDIQMQQEKRQLTISHSPKTRISGFSVSSMGSPTEAGAHKDSTPNRWFRPETDTPSSIRSIQIEERAMKDLKRFYKSVKLVKPQQQFV